MYPVYRGMDSFYPHQGNQMPYYPSFEAVSPQMKVDVSRPPATYESWPHGGFYGYPVPVGCQGCCGHNYFPGYYSFRPHHPPSTPSQIPHQGSYPPFPETYPVHYAPPPHYSMEQPRYVNEPRDHCCGCPNHMCNRKSSGVRIEEHEPDTENKNSTSVLPVESNNYPYPVVYIPPGHMKNMEHKKPIEVETKDKEEDPRDKNSPRSMKFSGKDPSGWSRWFPLDINSLGSLKHVGDEKRTQNRRNEDNSQFPFPVFWMPYKPDEMERIANKEDKESIEESPPNSRINDVALPEKENGRGKNEASKENFSSKVGPKMMEKNAYQKFIPVRQLEQHKEKGTSEVGPKMEGIGNPKLIPVKQLEHHDEKGTTEDAEGKAKRIAVKHTADGVGRGPSGKSTKGESSSPKRAAKLPPVCLRVDPLPRRKNGNGNGSSRSPSPPGQELSSDSYKSCTISSSKENAKQDMQCANSSLNKPVEAEQNKKAKEEVQTAEITVQDGNENSKAHTPLSREEVSTNQSTTKASICNIEGDEGLDKEDKVSGEEIELKDASSKLQSGDGESLGGEDKGATEVKGEQYEKAKNAAERKNLSEAEAAVIIQSTYRGFEERRWEPLKKLKLIAQVQEQVTEVRSCIQALESSSDCQIDDRQIAVIGETIMSLLLKLDTIQGLHASVRDIRKSVAKELISLQEKLDSLAISKCEALASKTVEDSIPEKQVEAEHEGLKGSENNNDKLESVEPSQGQLVGTMDATSDKKAAETSEVMMVEKEVCQESENKDHELPLVDELTTSATKPNDEENTEVIGVCQEAMSEMQNRNDSLLEQSADLPATAHDRHIHVEEKGAACLVDGTVSVDNDLGTTQLPELPQVAVEKEIAVESKGTCEGSQDATQSDKEAANMNMVEQKTRDAIGHGLVSAKVEQKVGSAKDEEFVDNHRIEPKEFLEESAKGEEDNVGSNKVDELPGHANLDVENFIVPSRGECVDVEWLGEVSKPKECQTELSLLGDNVHDGEQREADEMIDEKFSGLGEFSLDGSQPQLTMLDNKINDIDRLTSLGDEEFTEVTEESTKEAMEKEDQKLVQGMLESNDVESIAGTTREVSVATECTPSRAEQEAVESDNMIDKPCETQFDKEEVLVATSCEEQAKEGAFSRMSPPVSQVPVISDRKLMEENARLREMMEKLIEAGKHQLTTISELTERVKDLEKKLSKKKKPKTRRSRIATPGTSCH